MKKCPFCAEEIQDEAIKCKHCGSNLASAPSPDPQPAPPPLRPAGAPTSPHPDEPRQLLYDGVPSWRAYFGSYLGICVLAPVIAGSAYWIVTYHVDLPTLGMRALAAGIPLALGALMFLGVTLTRRSTRVRVTNRNVETEVGLFSKRIDVLELWRIRDVRYRQSLLDRILGIAHIDIFTKDVTSPNLEIVGLPASRQLFERLRDSIEIQRQSRRVMGIID